MCICFATNAQQHEVTDYIDVINERALNIATKLDINDSEKKELLGIIIKQYDYPLFVPMLKKGYI